MHVYTKWTGPGYNICIIASVINYLKFQISMQPSYTRLYSRAAVFNLYFHFTTTVHYYSFISSPSYDVHSNCLCSHSSHSSLSHDGYKNQVIGSSTYLSAGTLLPTGYSASYLTALFFASGVNLFVSRRKRRPFSVAGPTAWNGLQVALRLMPVGRAGLPIVPFVPWQRPPPRGTKRPYH